MSRTNDLKKKGASERTGTGAGGGPPFVRWPESYAWIEGTVTDFWSHRKYGDVAVFEVTGCSAGLEAKGRTEDGENYVIQVEPRTTVSVGLGYAALAGRIEEADKGGHFHVAFEGWEMPEDGDNRYRVFTVLEVPLAEAPPDNERTPMPQAAAIGGGPGAPGEEAPPIEDYDDFS